MPCEDKKNDSSQEKKFLGIFASKLFNRFPKLILDLMEEKYKSEQNSYLPFIKYTQVHHGYSSIKITKHLKSKDITQLGPRNNLKNRGKTFIGS